MDTIISHLEAYRGVYIVIAVVAAGAGGLRLLDGALARRARPVTRRPEDFDASRVVDRDNPWGRGGGSGTAM
ncbi:MAG: hypothetical protein ACRD1H_15080 [Vicinamibacterales bacterium]